MRLFDFIFGARKAAMPSDELRELLFAAIRASDQQRLAELASQHHDAILGERQEAEAAFRSGVDRAEHANDVDVRSCLMLELALVLPESSPSSSERIRLLEAVRELNGNLIATASAGLFLNTPGSH
jgi:hypothetical protein